MDFLHAILIKPFAALVATPALVLRRARARAVPRVVYVMAVLACLGGLLYRFVPTTLAYAPGRGSTYFPTVPEVLITLGLVAAVLAAFGWVVKRFAVLPAPLETWYHALEHTPPPHPAPRSDAHGHAAHD
jgi:Ni/Fe-hydrogenase subunit HybB-like protein